ncbi:ATP-binding cassette domain-containing protein [Acidobacteriota bacterium]
MNKPAILEIDNLKKTYASGFIPKKKEVIRGVSLSVRDSEIVGFLGPNGAGKTTIMKIIVGLVTPDAGSVTIMGSDYRDCRVRRHIGYLPENPVFYEYLSGEEFLWLAGGLSGMKKEQVRSRAEYLLDMTGLSQAGDLRVRKYSKGMLERLGMAQALMHDPDFLLLDEPMSGLDPIGRYHMRDLIMKQKEKGKSVFFSTHILADVEMICDRIVILVNGRVRSTGVLSELLSEEISSHEITCSVEGEPPGGEGVRILARDGNRLLVETSTEEVLTEFLEALRARGGKLLSLAPKKKTLEELFMEEVANGGTP